MTDGTNLLDLRVPRLFGGAHFDGAHHAAGGDDGAGEAGFHGGWVGEAIPRCFGVCDGVWSVRGWEVVAAELAGVVSRVGGWLEWEIGMVRGGCGR